MPKRYHRQPGQLREKIRIYSYASGKDDAGGPQKAGETLHATMMAHVRWVSAKEYLSSDRVVAKQSAVFTVRWIGTITTEMRVLHVESARMFYIRGVTDPDMHRNYLELQCEAVR